MACLTVFMLTSCEKDDNLELSTSDYIIFGHFYGKCVGEQCIEIFRLENEKLFEDTKTNIRIQVNFMEEFGFNYRNKNSLTQKT